MDKEHDTNPLYCGTYDKRKLGTKNLRLDFAKHRLYVVEISNGIIMNKIGVN